MQVVAISAGLLPKLQWGRSIESLPNHLTGTGGVQDTPVRPFVRIAVSQREVVLLNREGLTRSQGPLNSCIDLPMASKIQSLWKKKDNKIGWWPELEAPRYSEHNVSMSPQIFFHADTLYLRFFFCFV